MNVENVIVVVNDTRLDGLKRRFNTKAQAKFYIEQSGGHFSDYESEHEVIHRSLDSVTKTIQAHLKLKVVERKYLSNFIFSEKDIIVVVGQDGLVANTAKYAGELPIFGVNPDVNRYDGVLLPFTPATFEKGFVNFMEGKANIRKVTLAEAKTNDGQRLLAFNDLFIGPSSHTSARYSIQYQKHSENQSSSGIIISTGAGSTGWLSSVINMSNGVQKIFNAVPKDFDLKIKWEDDKLIFVVREPFRSKYSQAGIVAGIIHKGDKLTLESQMPSQGVIFSDGMETDYLAFNSGTKVDIAIAKQKANLVL